MLVVSTSGLPYSPIQILPRMTNKKTSEIDFLPGWATILEGILQESRSTRAVRLACRHNGTLYLFGGTLPCSTEVSEKDPGVNHVIEATAQPNLLGKSNRRSHRHAEPGRACVNHIKRFLDLPNTPIPGRLLGGPTFAGKNGANKYPADPSG